MLKKILGVTVLASVLLLVGCGKLPPLPSSTVAKMDFGPKPINLKMENLKSAFPNLKDPYSAIITEVNNAKYPRRGYMQDVNGKLYWKGWVALVYLNAKNSYGGYTGDEAFFVTIKNGKGFVPSRNVGQDPFIYFVK